MTKDVNLQNRVSEALEFEPGIHAEKIGVTVEDGVITLAGEVPTYAEKFGAVRTAKRVWGVKAIADELDVVLPIAHQRNDSDLAHSALLALEWDAIVPDNAIKITVTHGRVTLEGSVDWQYQKDAAIRAVRNLTGVKSLINNITVRPRVSPQSVREKIEKAFKRSAELEAAKITVEAREGTVTLRGNVHSLVEREEAERAAWAAPGVSRVEDHLMVVPA
jgi:osmotically-inducible protein OsmY